VANDYKELAAFVRAHKSDPVAAAKILTAWQWTSLLPGGHGTRPTDAESVPAVLNASCGFRDILLKALFAEIGIEGRRVNFYHVPFQGNHTATELKIDGKWMFFDATFGIYFESRKGGPPLSIAEAREQWPDVVVKKATLPGWQGRFVDLDSIGLSTFKTMTDSVAYQPTSLYGLTDAISGEINSLYFGPEAAYYALGRNTYIDAGEHTWRTRYDKADAYAWDRYTSTLDASGRLDAQYGSNDDGSTWHTDWDLAGQHAWSRKTTFATAGNRLDYSVTILDSKEKVVLDNDQSSAFAWSRKVTTYSASGRLDRQVIDLDDGGKVITDWDEGNTSGWRYYQDQYAAGGSLATTFVQYDDGTNRTIVWSEVPAITGTGARDVLTGTSALEFLRGLAGNDVLVGGSGPDRMEGGVGNDAYYVDDARDLAIETANAGIDTVYASLNYGLGLNLENLVLRPGVVYGDGNNGANAITGNAAANVLSGRAGDDQLYGLAGDDRLAAGEGRDLLDGGAGRDALYGNSGADTFLWRRIGDTGVTTGSADLVGDFSRSNGDRLHVALIDADTGRSGNQTFSFIGQAAFSAAGQVRYVHVAGETRLFLNTDADSSAEGIIRLAGLHRPDETWFAL
jgi:Ca2+-binding RTX toxin-like protein